MWNCLRQDRGCVDVDRLVDLEEGQEMDGYLIVQGPPLQTTQLIIILMTLGPHSKSRALYSALGAARAQLQHHHRHHLFPRQPSYLSIVSTSFKFLFVSSILVLFPRMFCSSQAWFPSAHLLSGLSCPAFTRVATVAAKQVHKLGSNPRYSSENRSSFVFRNGDRLPSKRSNLAINSAGSLQHTPHPR